MDAPRFLSVEEVTQLHRQAIVLYGGDLGLRDGGLLESAVLAVQQTFGGQYLYPSLIEMAAAYWFGLVQNHPFVDGNKRVGLRAADVFLALNGLDLIMSDTEVLEVTLQIALGQLEHENLIERIRQGVMLL